ncbi:PaaI family thioesterase [Mycobacterium aquaticum]|uniref:Aromatic compound degradation protein PaaI n=1 Tax=Mycobacterium aquaticum TaxID=1927124 RepID=A0A1X0ASF2_9MYCO|nr:PaaI family thioesterase [Mycobacterium aquaticum]ORA32808.1 aromatic compound degradation protein PaaI [Mycobacterium aquaticum]
MAVRNAPQVRERIIHWDDPQQLANAGHATSGRAFLDAILAGDIPHPPICELIGFAFEEIDDGRVVMTFNPHESQYNPIGMVHGGAISTVLDSVMGCAVHSMLPRGRGYTTLELKVNMLRAVRTQTGQLHATGKVLHLGRQTAMAEASLIDKAGKVYARATTTCLVVDTQSIEVRYG